MLPPDIARLVAEDINDTFVVIKEATEPLQVDIYDTENFPILADEIEERGGKIEDYRFLINAYFSRALEGIEGYKEILRELFNSYNDHTIVLGAQLRVISQALDNSVEKTYDLLNIRDARSAEIAAEEITEFVRWLSRRAQIINNNTIDISNDSSEEERYLVPEHIAEFCMRVVSVIFALANRLAGVSQHIVPRILDW